MKQKALALKAVQSKGFESLEVYLEDFGLENEVIGICTGCKCVLSKVEAESKNVSCEKCGENKVCSVLILGGIVE